MTEKIAALNLVRMPRSVPAAPTLPVCPATSLGSSVPAS